MTELDCGCDLVLVALPSRTVKEYDFFDIDKLVMIKEYYCPNHQRYVRRKDHAAEALEGKELKV
jgi:hypothetical protein